MQGMPEISVIAGLALGWLMQFARSYKSVNNWLVWAGVGVAAAGLWYWMTPDANEIFHASWRNGLAQIIGFAASAGGFGKLLKDGKLAAPADSK